MLRKTVKIYRRMSWSWERGYIRDEKHTEEIIRETWWILFVPIYSRETLYKHNI